MCLSAIGWQGGPFKAQNFISWKVQCSKLQQEAAVWGWRIQQLATSASIDPIWNTHICLLPRWTRPSGVKLRGCKVKRLEDAAPSVHCSSWDAGFFIIVILLQCDNKICRLSLICALIQLTISKESHLRHTVVVLWAGSLSALQLIQTPSHMFTHRHSAHAVVQAHTHTHTAHTHTYRSRYGCKHSRLPHTADMWPTQGYIRSYWLPRSMRRPHTSTEIWKTSSVINSETEREWAAVCFRLCL